MLYSFYCAVSTFSFTTAPEGFILLFSSILPLESWLLYLSDSIITGLKLDQWVTATATIQNLNPIFFLNRLYVLTLNVYLIKNFFFNFELAYRICLLLKLKYLKNHNIFLLNNFAFQIDVRLILQHLVSVLSTAVWIKDFQRYLIISNYQVCLRT